MKPYRKVLSAAHSKLMAEIDQIRSSIPHRGESGALIENRIRDHLLTFLPEKVGVSSGFVLDADGSVSRQMDVILFDKANTPRIFANDGAQMFPVESTCAAGEIKTRLDAQSLGDAFEKCWSYKKLNRRAYYENKSALVRRHTLFGKEHEHWQSIFFCIGSEGASAETLLEQYLKIVDGTDCDQRIDVVVTLNGPCLVYSNGSPRSGVPTDGSLDLLPSPGSTVCGYNAKDPWALFIFLLLRYMVQVPESIVNMLPYDDGQPF